MRRTNYYVALLAVAVAGVITGCGGFGDADLESIRSDIRSEYGKRDGVIVNEVFIELQDGKPAGFVKFSVLGIEVMHSCSTTVFDDGQYTWQCQP